MTLNEFNALDKETAAAELFQCCGSSNWVSLLMKYFPFATEKILLEKATLVWYKECNKADWLESFSHHPQIGDKKSLQLKFAGKEQSGIVSAPDDVIEALAKANAAYLQQFGFIFIVCATGKKASEMLQLIQCRLHHTASDELNIAMGEQHKITLMRFQKLLKNTNFQFLKMSQLTTHVLDTAMGTPGKNISVKLQQQENKNWQNIAQGITDNNGRITDLLPPGKLLIPGTYKFVFDTGAYFEANGVQGFYPEVEIQFTVFNDVHYHVPLLISPFGYSTYRGS